MKENQMPLVLKSLNKNFKQCKKLLNVSTVFSKDMRCYTISLIICVGSDKSIYTKSKELTQIKQITYAGKTVETLNYVN